MKTNQQKVNRESVHQNLEKQRERSRRSHRLIVKGLIIENLFPETVVMNPDEFRAFLYQKFPGDTGETGGVTFEGDTIYKE